jgi:ATP-dependent helicase/nuclease subunit A
MPAPDAPILLPILPSVLTTSAPIAIKTGASQVVAEKPTPESLIGQAMHRLLEWTALDAQGWTPAQVQRAAAEFGLDAAQAQQAAAMAQRILLGAGAWAWRADAVDWHGNEVPVTVQGSVRRIDRLVRRKTETNVGEWWVLDYKSATQPQGSHELLAQLRSYRAAVQAASPGEPVRAAFLSAAGTLEEIQGNE